MSYNNRSQIQNQTRSQDYSQLQRQKQDLVHCNNSFGKLVFSMEILLIKSGYNLKELFGYNNHFNNASRKTKEKIRAQINLDLMANKIQKIAYNQKYKKYDYPNSPPIKDIIKMIKNWKASAKEKDLQKLCNNILDLIKDENEKPISFYQSRAENTKSATRADPVENVQMANKIYNIMDKRNEKINKKIQDNQNAKFGLVIGEEYSKGEFNCLKKDENKKKKKLKQN